MKKVITIIFDGFGLRDEEKGNAVKAADMSNFNQFFTNYPHSVLEASEERVGLMKGQFGNSEIGHMSIGAGRMIKSPMLRIKEFFESNLDENDAVNKLTIDNTRRVHLMGLCSDGGIHSSVNHFLSMGNLLNNYGFKNIYYHLITDGRDTKVNVAYNYIKMVQDNIDTIGFGKIASVCGRYYAMDRDKNYDRTSLYYDLVTKGVGVYTTDIEKTINISYDNGITDEFIKPILLSQDGLIKDGDILIWLNYREDRAKQILSSFVCDNFDGFDTIKYNNLDVFSMMDVDKNIHTNVFIKAEDEGQPLGLYLASLGLRQARVAESEKYAHVTYFFDGGFDGKLNGCDRIHVPSPKIASYDLMPEMSAVEVTKKAMGAMQNDYDFVLVNFANPDMVGHTGVFDAAVKACETVDVCFGKLLECAEDNFYTVIVLADHGNADTMLNDDGSVCTTHSISRVPFVISDKKIKLKSTGDLTNVAPTILNYMDILIPSSMTSDSLIIE